MHRFRWTIFPILILALAGPGTARAAETHPFSVRDMLAMDRISDTQISPDGFWIIFNVRETDLEANRGRTDVWIADADGGNIRLFVFGLGDDVNTKVGDVLR